MKNVFGFLFGSKVNTNNVKENASNEKQLASIENVKNVGETILYTLEEVEKMTTTEAVEALKKQLEEKKAIIFEKCTNSAKIKKELEKAEKKEKETLAEYTLATMDATTPEKKKATTKENSNFWYNMKKELEARFKEAVALEAEAEAKKKEMKKKALETLEAMEAEEITMKEALAMLTTEELEIMKAVASEKKAEKKKKALEATNKATEASTLAKVASVAVAQRHEEEGKATEKELAEVTLAEVETEKASVWDVVSKKVKETEKATSEKVKAELKKEYTISKAINKMKEEAETWQNIYDGAKVAVKVSEITPASIFSNAHVFLLVPTGNGLKVGTGRGIKAVEKWALETLHQFIIVNDTLNKQNLSSEELEAHKSLLEKAEARLATLKALEEKKAEAKAEKEKKKAEKAEAEKATSVASVETLEAVKEAVEMATSNEKALAEAVAEVKAEALEAVAEVKAEKVETLEAVKEAKETSRGRGRGRAKKAEKALEAVKEATTPVEATEAVAV